MTSIISQEEISAIQNDIAEIERRLNKSIFADPEFDPEEWLQEREL